jgi:hypothetical protein
VTAGADVWVDRLDELARSNESERVSIAEVLAAAGEGGLAAVILLLALPNTLPSLPGMSTVFGLPLLLFTAQQALGQCAWLPRWLARKTLARAQLRVLTSHLGRLAVWSSGCTRVRLHDFAGPLAMRLAGVVGFAVAVLLVLPFPLVNIPSGVTLSLMAFGGLRGDGAAVLLGFACGIATLVLAVGVVWSAWVLF